MSHLTITRKRFLKKDGTSADPNRYHEVRFALIAVSGRDEEEAEHDLRVNWMDREKKWLRLPSDVFKYEDVLAFFESEPVDYSDHATQSDRRDGKEMATQSDAIGCEEWERPDDPSYYGPGMDPLYMDEIKFDPDGLAMLKEEEVEEVPLDGGIDDVLESMHEDTNEDGLGDRLICEKDDIEELESIEDDVEMKHVNIFVVEPLAEGRSGYALRKRRSNRISMEDERNKKRSQSHYSLRTRLSNPIWMANENEYDVGMDERKVKTTIADSDEDYNPHQDSFRLVKRKSRQTILIPKREMPESEDGEKKKEGVQNGKKRMARCGKRAKRRMACTKCRLAIVAKEDDLREHSYIHWREYPFKCRDCEYGHSERKQVKKHMIEDHGIDDEEPEILENPLRAAKWQAEREECFPEFEWPTNAIRQKQSQYDCSVCKKRVKGHLLAEHLVLDHSKNLDFGRPRREMKRYFKGYVSDSSEDEEEKSNRSSITSKSDRSIDSNDED